MFNKLKLPLTRTVAQHFCLVLCVAALAACDSDSSNDLPVATGMISSSGAPAMQAYDVTVTNLTYGQPMSPVAVVMHNGGFVAWRMGSAASDGLEQLAEGGDHTALLNEADATALATSSGTGIILPGGRETISVSGAGANTSVGVAVVTMLVNTNDAFTGLTRVAVAGLAVGESTSVMMPVFDAGTEFNSAAAGTIPGPEDGGEGFNVARDDTNIVTRHPGIAIGDALSEAARFDGPVAHVTVTRTL